MKNTSIDLQLQYRELAILGFQSLSHFWVVVGISRWRSGNRKMKDTALLGEVGVRETELSASASPSPESLIESMDFGRLGGYIREQTLLPVRSSLTDSITTLYSEETTTTV